MGVELEAAEREYDIYPLLVQALSLREWKDKSDRYCSYALLLPGCDSDAWRRSVLPGVLDLMIEVLNLLQIIINDFGADQATYFMTHTTLQYQLMELVADVYVLSSLVGDDKDNQQLAKNEGLLRIVLSNWNLMKIAHLRGSQLILSALRFVANYSYGNDSAKGSLLAILPSPTGKNVGGDSGQSVILLLFDLVSTRGEVAHRISGGGAVAPSASDMVLSNTACQILKSVLLNAECVLASVKTGSISKLVDALQDRLQQTRQTSKTDQLEFENLAHMLSVLGSIACSEEGARVLYASYATSVSLIMDDMMNSSNDLIRRNGCMFLRNLALSQATKNNFALWEERLDAVVAACVHESKSAQDGSTALEYLSTTLWSLVYDNQKARALLLSRPNALQNLQQILESRQSDLQISLESEEPQTFSKDIVENLRRVLLLVRE
ncbi:hypothetical protein PHYBOEH_006718 [Phytophthora boehmeriae]|uniref:Uncharacterized protein n=1 Tax=Phytophthora boehmeriae TaxID=109152 RepID=A0A8T1X8V3_9STRA|nr:hypothetical protein PHYBOEH_006718 [Phytophthora boehmeriae]